MEPALPPLTPSTLYLVATPIGNLEDITLRALRTLKECDMVAAEDTRRTGLLLKHFGISKPLLSYFQFNEAKRSEEIIERLRRGEKIALMGRVWASQVVRVETQCVSAMSSVISSRCQLSSGRIASISLCSCAESKSHVKSIRRMIGGESDDAK